MYACICITTLHDCITVEEEADDDDDVAPESSPPTAATVPQDEPSRHYPLIYGVREEHQNTSKIMFSSDWLLEDCLKLN